MTYHKHTDSRNADKDRLRPSPTTAQRINILPHLDTYVTSSHHLDSWMLKVLVDSDTRPDRRGQRAPASWPAIHAFREEMDTWTDTEAGVRCDVSDAQGIIRSRCSEIALTYRAMHAGGFRSSPSEDVATRDDRAGI